MDRTQTVSVVYGGHNTRADCFILPRHDGHWYVIDGSKNINFTRDPITPGCSVEDLHDTDYKGADHPVTSEEQLVREVDS